VPADDPWDHVCQVCFWQSDQVEERSGYTILGPNKVPLAEAKLNFKRFGACEERLRKKTRPPKADELPTEERGSEMPAESVVAKKKTGLYVALAGVATEALGFVLLSHGSMDAAPALICGSFVIMGIGIWIGWD
jgi:hypothetical protein